MKILIRTLNKDEVINIPEIIGEIPRLLQFFVSGFIFLKILTFLNAKNNCDTSFVTVWSIVISFIIMNVVKLFDVILYPNYALPTWAEVIICLFVAVVSAFITYKLLGSRFFSCLLYKITKKSVNTDIWKDIVDYDKSTIFKVFLKSRNITYIGKLIAHEEKGLDSWFVFRDYICTYTDTGEEFNSTNQECPSTVAINLNEIERVELFYDKDTEIFS